MAQREENRRPYSEAVSELLKDLSAAGFHVNRLAELRESGNRQAVPVLIKWLPRVEYEPLKRDTIAVLEVRCADPNIPELTATPDLIAEAFLERPVSPVLRASGFSALDFCFATD